MFSRTLQLLIQILNVDKNYQIKWYGQGRRRRLLWISFQLAVLLKIFIRMTFTRSLWKGGLAELFRIPYFCGRSLVLIIGCENFLSLNLYVIRMYLSIVFFLLHVDSKTLWLQNLSFDTLSKWLLNLELIISHQRQNENSVYSFWSLVDIDNLII